MADTLILKCFTGEILLAPDAESIRAKALEVAATIKQVTNPAELKQATDAMAVEKRIIKAVEGERKVITRPIDDLKAVAMKLERDYLDPLKASHDKLQGMANHFLDLQRRAEREREQEAFREQQRAQLAAQEAQEALQQAERLRQQGKLVQAEKLEDAALTKQLELESAEMALVPVEAVKVSGLTVRERVNFQVENPIAFLAAFPNFWKASENKEELKIKRMELLDALNLLNNRMFTERYKEGLPMVQGLRVYFEVKGYTR